MTVHAAKGLEFPYVYVVGMEENLFPSESMNDTPDKIEEERRLFYVAITRAEKAVTVSYAQNRRKWGSEESNRPSRFLREIDRKYYERFGVRPMDPGYLKTILGEPDERYYNILLGHNPDYADRYAQWGADLSLSGHVHGGIARIPLYREGKWRLCGVLSPNIRFFPKYDCGSFSFGDRTVLVSRGLGMHTIPIRFLNPGELMVLNLVPEEAARE